jgi:hypothetical protein
LRGGLPKGEDAAKSGHHAVIPVTFERQRCCRRARATSSRKS